MSFRQGPANMTSSYFPASSYGLVFVLLTALCGLGAGCRQNTAHSATKSGRSCQFLPFPNSERGTSVGFAPCKQGPTWVGLARSRSPYPEHPAWLQGRATTSTSCRSVDVAARALCGSLVTLNSDVIPLCDTRHVGEPWGHFFGALFIVLGAI